MSAGQVAPWLTPLRMLPAPLSLQVASVMGTITLELLHAIHPISCTRDVLEKDTQELEAAGFLKQVKDAPGQWTFAQVGRLPCLARTERHAFPGLHDSSWAARQHSTQAEGRLQQHAASADKARHPQRPSHHPATAAMPAPRHTLAARPLLHCTYRCWLTPSDLWRLSTQEDAATHRQWTCKAVSHVPKSTLAWPCPYLQVLAQDVANSLIPFSQRRNLHFKLAEALEASHTIPPVPAAIIGFHFAESCKHVEGDEWRRAMKAVEYWEKAALEAMEGIDHLPVSNSGAHADGFESLRGLLQSAWHWVQPAALAITGRAGTHVHSKRRCRQVRRCRQQCHR